MVAGAEEVVAFECQPSGAARRPGGELRRPVGAAVAIIVMQRLDIAAARNDHAAARIEGHRVDVVHQVVAGERADAETVRHAKLARFLGPGGDHRQGERDGKRMPWALHDDS